MEKRLIEERIMKAIMTGATALIIASFLAVLIVIIIRGLPAIDLAMLTQTPKGGFYLGKEGGILNAISGSLALAAGATFIALIISLSIVLYINLFLKKGALLGQAAAFSLTVLWGIPSIVYGAFGFILLLFFGLSTSLLGGIITIALLEIPIMARAIDEVVKMTPGELIEASYSLGATKLETAFKVVARQAGPGIVTAVLVAFGRGIGDAAAVLFTAGFSDNIPSSLFRPAATLPLAVFFQIGTPFPEVQRRGYASALVLTVIVLLISIISRILFKKFMKQKI
jgi:phosphate transport system permease protein